MNVSSVKNLNGETFSAVQDATLTNVVQSNSAQWNEISAYELASATYLTAHQSLEDYATTADVDSISSMLSGAIDYVSSNAGGNDLVHKSDFTFVSDQWGTYLQKVSGKYIDYATRAGQAELDSNGHTITAQYFTTANANTLSSMLSGAIDYVSANAGGEFPQSADEAIQCVQTNSGTWNDVTSKLDTTAFTAWSSTQADNNYQLSAGDGVSIVDDNINKITRIDVTAQGGISLTGDAQGAVDNVYTNSGKYVLNNANGVYIGNDNTATLNGFAQGGSNKAQSYAFSQGLYNSAIGYSIAQGQFCTASNESIAQGVSNSATDYSQAFGSHTKASNSGMAIGTYNNINTAAFVIGNGNSNQRSDCFIIDHNGNVSACGKISANGVELGAGEGGGNPEVESYVTTNSGIIDNVNTTYQTKSASYLTAHQSLDGYATTAWVTGRGYLTAVSLSSLNTAQINNIIVTASLPGSPNAKTLYLIKE